VEVWKKKSARPFCSLRQTQKPKKHWKYKEKRRIKKAKKCRIYVDNTKGT
jgi:hypothetical protein